MRAALRQALEISAIELYAAKMPLAIVTGVGGYEERIFNRAFNVEHFEIALGDLVD